MAGSSFFALLDDIASVLDDVATMTKSAAQKTAGVLGDDLALNANQVAGIKADRELPVVWAVAKGSFKNKLILVPLALLISIFLPSLVQPLLMIGGLFLCFEGVEKLAHKFLHHANDEKTHHDEHLAALNDLNVDMVAFEKEKIKGAIRTDFILSAEIVVLTLDIVTEKGHGLWVKAAVLSAIAVLMTVGVYGLVAGIVRADDLGLSLLRQKALWKQKIGALLLKSMPYFMKGLSFLGTLAMFMVGGGILVHGIPFLHHVDQSLSNMLSMAQSASLIQSIFSGLMSAVFALVIGVIAGGLVLGSLEVFKKIRCAKA